MTGLRRQKPWQKWLLVFGVWTLIGLAFASQFNFMQSRRGQIVTWSFALTTSLSDWYVFAVLSMPALWVARRFPIEGPRWRRSVIVHAVAAVFFAVAWVLLRTAVEKVRFMERQIALDFFEMAHWTLARSFYFNLLVYGVIVGASHAFSYYRRYQERELHALELERLLAQARLESLQAQLNPHFLFNTLNSIASLMRKDVEAADRMIVRLSELLREALKRVATQEVPLRDELRFLRSYLEIEQSRFGNRLSVWIDTPEDTLDALVPNLVLQPLVENAIKHGIESRARPGRIDVLARRAGDRLRVEVRDNGKGGPPAGELTEGIGLSNTRQRLRHLHGENHAFECRNAPEGGFIVALEMPFHTPALDSLAAPETLA